MKSSRVFGFLIFLVVVITAFALVNNESKELRLPLNMSTGERETFSPYSPIDNLMRMSDEGLKIKKSKERNKILMIGGGFLSIFLIAFFLTKANEDKKDPLKNLEILKNNNIISQSEYDEKVHRSKIIGDKKKEFQKLLAELDNLKAKEILTDEEYQQKLIKIKEKKL